MNRFLEVIDVNEDTGLVIKNNDLTLVQYWTKKEKTIIFQRDCQTNTDEKLKNIVKLILDLNNGFHRKGKQTDKRYNDQR